MKRVMTSPGSETARGVATTFGKRYNTNHAPSIGDERSIPQPENNGAASVAQCQEEHPPSYDLDWSVFDDQINSKNSWASYL